MTNKLLISHSTKLKIQWNKNNVKIILLSKIKSKKDFRDKKFRLSYYQNYRSDSGSKEYIGKFFLNKLYLDEMIDK